MPDFRKVRHKFTDGVASVAIRTSNVGVFGKNLLRLVLHPLDGLHAGYSVDKAGSCVHKAKVDAIVHQRFQLTEDVVRFHQFFADRAKHIFGVAGLY